MNKKEIENIIQKYKDYLNNGQSKPQWRINEVNNFINVMNRIVQNG